MFKQILLIGTVATLSIAAICHGGQSRFVNLGTLQGVVTDSSGQVIVGASAKLVGINIGSMTDISGTYQIKRIQPGVYAVEVVAVGFKVIEFRKIRVTGGVTTNLNAKLTPYPVHRELYMH